MPNHPDLYKEREALALNGYQPFDSRKARLVVNQLINPVQANELRALRWRNSSVVTRYNDIFTRLQITKPEQIEAEALSAYYVTDTAVDRFRSFAETARDRGDRNMLVFAFDTDYGAATTVQGLITMDIKRNNRTGGRAFEEILGDIAEKEKTRGKVFSISDQASSALRYNQLERALIMLYEEDPTRLTIVHESANSLRGQTTRIPKPPLAPHHLVPEFVTAGADFAEKLFIASIPVSRKTLADLR